jgi:hypothetical protein
MSEEISLSIEETNVLREKLGLKPLQLKPVEDVDESSLDRKPPNPSKKSIEENEYLQEGKRIFENISGGGSILDTLNDFQNPLESDSKPQKIHKRDASEDRNSSSDSDSSEFSSDNN